MLLQHTPAVKVQLQQPLLDLLIAHSRVPAVGGEDCFVQYAVGEVELGGDVRVGRQVPVGSIREYQEVLEMRDSVANLSLSHE